MAIEIKGNTVTFTMKIKKDSLKAPEHTIDVEVDIAGIKLETFIKVCFSGSSARVRLQSKLRKKSEGELAKLAANGLKITLKSIMEKDAAQEYADAMMALTREQFVERVVKDFGATPQQANEMYDRKHANDDEE